MSNQFSHITLPLLGKKSIEECSLSSIRQLCADYPWLATAHLLLTKKLKDAQDPAWEDAYEKASLFFPSTIWLNFLLDSDKQKVNSAEAITSSDKTITAKNELLFEPYYTIDYFASQGIQYKAEEKPTDKFGQQLKSFTEWIKEMKKLPLSEIGKTVNPQEEKKVQQMASHSLSQDDVVTEAMADIWIKQGNINKAKEVLHKLSLLDPSKSAYFANRIKELN